MNFSVRGGRLHGLVDASSVPDRIIIYMRDYKITKRECRVIWRKAQDIGVQFLTPPKIIKFAK